MLLGGYLCVDASKGIRLQKCTEMDGPQKWQLPPLARDKSDPGTVYSPASGLCMGLKDEKVTTVICEEEKSKIWIFKPV